MQLSELVRCQLPQGTMRAHRVVVRAARFDRRADNGPEFAGKVLDAWAYEAGVTLSFIRPGRPVENAYIESFNGRFRDECLNEHWFVSMRHARRLIEDWRIEYNTERPHSSLGHLAPVQFAQAHEARELLTSDSNGASY